jgi:hypothetical protein
MIKGILHYELKGICGWGNCQLTKIDVSNVSKICPRKRLFMIFNRQYPYTMGIEYELPRTVMTAFPVVGGNGGCSMGYHTVMTQWISRRYKTETEMNYDHQNIIDMQNKLKEYSQKKSEEILKEIENDRKPKIESQK